MVMACHLSKNKFITCLKALCILLVPVALWFVPIISNEDASWSFCIFKNLTGHTCYGCGITRASLSLLHLRFNQALGFNKSVIIVFPILVFLWASRVINACKTAMKVLENGR
jgi:hypothetical protein